MRRAAIYARYSTDLQRETSIEDQTRRAKEKATQLGYDVPKDLIFSDSAITGQEKAIAKRVEYAKLIDACLGGKVDAVVVDELSRLSRDNLELVKLQKIIKENGIRLITVDGVDSSVYGWQLAYGIRGVISAYALEETAHRVKRGMQGQLERGKMIGAPPFGYSHKRLDDGSGTIWQIEEKEALLVREIFKQKRDGQSLGSIAKWLNERNIPTPRPPKKDGESSYWRPATVRQMLKNTVYKGVFIYNGSASAKAKAKKEKKEIESIEYPRDELRIVSDLVWSDCNEPTNGRERNFRGGGKCVFAGILTCNRCESTLSFSNGGSVPSAHCAQCAQAKRVGIANRQAYYVSINSIKAALIYTLKKMFTDTVLEDFKECLRKKMTCGSDAKLIEIKNEIVLCEKAISRLLELISNAEAEDSQLTKRYNDATHRKKKLNLELKELQSGLAIVDKAVIEKQLSANPIDLLPDLFEEDLPVERVRAVLHRLFPVIRFIKKPNRQTAIYYIEVAPGVAFAEATDTQVIETKKVAITLSVSWSSKKQRNWVVTELIDAN